MPPGATPRPNVGDEVNVSEEGERPSWHWQAALICRLLLEPDVPLPIVAPVLTIGSDLTVTGRARTPQGPLSTAAGRCERCGAVRAWLHSSGRSSPSGGM